MKTTSHNRTVIITGGATGIGYATAEQFLAQHANDVLVGRTAEKWGKAAGMLRKPDRVMTTAANITKPEAAPQIIAAKRPDAL